MTRRADEAREALGVSGFGEFIHQLRAGHVANGLSHLAGLHPKSYEQVALAGARVPEEHHRFGALEVGARRQGRDHRRVHARDPEVEVLQQLHPREPRGLDPAQASALVALVHFG